LVDRSAGKRTLWGLLDVVLFLWRVRCEDLSEQGKDTVQDLLVLIVLPACEPSTMARSPPPRADATNGTKMRWEERRRAMLNL
jgi:hypothetical protein